MSTPFAHRLLLFWYSADPVAVVALMLIFSANCWYFCPRTCHDCIFSPRRFTLSIWIFVLSLDSRNIPMHWHVYTRMSIEQYSNEWERMGEMQWEYAHAHPMRAICVYIHQRWLRRRFRSSYMSYALRLLTFRIILLTGCLQLAHSAHLVESYLRKNNK